MQMIEQEREFLQFIEWLRKPNTKGQSWKAWLENVSNFECICKHNFPAEDAEFAQFIQDRQPLRVAEWGIGDGYWSNILFRACHEEAEFASFDIMRTPVMSFLIHMMGERQTLFSFVGDSREFKTALRVWGCHSKRNFDLIFIDSDHTEETSRAEFKLYWPTVKSGGVLAFHDIHMSRGGPPGVDKLWDEVKTQFESYEFVNHGSLQACLEAGDHCYGIGAIIKP